MKKWIAVFLLIACVQAPAIAAQRGTPEYEQMKELKKKQRENKPQQQAAEAAKEPSQMDLFWKKEGERSGLSGVGAGIGNSVTGFFSSLKNIEMPKKHPGKKTA